MTHGHTQFATVAIISLFGALGACGGDDPDVSDRGSAVTRDTPLPDDAPARATPPAPGPSLRGDGIAIAKADVSACADLVQKIYALEPFARGDVLLQVRATGGAVKFRTAPEGERSVSSIFLGWSNRARGAIPSELAAGASGFTMVAAQISEFTTTPGSLNGTAFEVFPSRADAPERSYDTTGISITAEGQLRFAYISWTGATASDSDITECTRVGQEDLGADRFPEASEAQRTVPIVLVNAVKTFPGWGSDAFQFVLRPSVLIRG